MKNRFFAILALAMSLVSCERAETELSGGNEPLPDGKVRIPITLQLPVREHVQTKSSNTVDENRIDNLWVLVFEAPTGTGTGDFNPDDRLIQIKKSALAGSGSAYIVLDAYASPVRLRVLANVSTALEATLNAFKTVTQDAANATKFSDYIGISETLAALYTSATTPATINPPFPMSTQGVRLTEITSTTSLSLQLECSYARIDVNSTASGFTFTSAKLINAAKQGYLRPQPSGLPTDFGGEIAYAAMSAAAGKVSPIYLYENNGGANAANTTDIIVYGTKAGSPAGYYKLRIVYDKSGADCWDIVRNTLYTVNITKVNGSGYTSEAEAIANSPANVEYSVNVTDPSSRDIIISNGQYYMGFSNSDYVLFADGAQTALTATTVTHNAPSTVTSATVTASGTGLTLVNQDGVLTVSGGVNGTFAVKDGTVQKIDVKVDLAAGFTSGKLVFRIGDLYREVNITRQAQFAAEPFVSNYFSAAKYIYAELAAPTPWLQLGITSSAFVSDTWVSSTSGIYLNVLGNQTDNAPARSTELYLARSSSEGVVKGLVSQNPAMLPVLGFVIGRFAGWDGTKYTRSLDMDRKGNTTSGPNTGMGSDPTKQWNNVTTSYPTIQNTSYGWANTYDVNVKSTFAAMWYCRGKNGNAATTPTPAGIGWYLPSKEELMAMWIVAPAYSTEFTLGASNYWSSTENEVAAWICSDYGNTSGQESKIVANMVRCVRGI